MAAVAPLKTFLAIVLPFVHSLMVLASGLKGRLQKRNKSYKNKLYFEDVVGNDEAKHEMMEIVDGLKNPKKYEELGVKIQRAVLLIGAQGTGKTLLAKATAAEAGVPFLSKSSYDFNMSNGGVSKLRKLFKQAKKCAPSIIFIHEINAMDEDCKRALDQLLVEVDGYESAATVVVIANTTGLDVVDEIFLRRGRFGRLITIDQPDLKGREHIFQLYLKKINIDNEVSYYSERLAALTVGYIEADIAYVCNEANLIASRIDGKQVKMQHFLAAIDRFKSGLEAKSMVLRKLERRYLAYHEAGHAVVMWLLQHVEPLWKVTIIPHENSLGYASFVNEDYFLWTKEQLFDLTCVYLGGRASEQVLLGKISEGAESDLEWTTKFTYDAIATYGFGEKIGPLSYPERGDKPYSDQTKAVIDSEVQAWVSKAYALTIQLIQNHKDQVAQIAESLLKEETLYHEDLIQILGQRPFKSNEVTNYERFKQGFQADNTLKLQHQS